MISLLTKTNTDLTPYLVLCSAIGIHLCIGGLYAWSEFVPVLHKQYQLTTAQTQFIFGSLITIFTVVMIFAGRWERSLGSRIIVLTGGLFFGGGYLLASYSSGSFIWIWLGLSLMGGIGTGLCYVVPISVCTQWFPHRKGLITGLIVAGFGGGAILLSLLSEHWMNQGIHVLEVWRKVGYFYGSIIVLASCMLHFPSHNLPPISNFFLYQLIKDRHFWALYLGIFVGTFAGLLVIGNLKPLLLSFGIDPLLATLAISIFAIGNTTGRILWGWITDHIQNLAISVSLCFLATVSLLSLFLLRLSWGAILCSFLIGLGFGACFVVYAFQVNHHYGQNNFNTIYPFVFLGYGLSGLVGPWIGGWIYDLTNQYYSALILSILIVVGGWIGTLRLFRKQETLIPSPSQSPL